MCVAEKNALLMEEWIPALGWEKWDLMCNLFGDEIKI